MHFLFVSQHLRSDYSDSDYPKESDFSDDYNAQTMAQPQAQGRYNDTQSVSLLGSLFLFLSVPPSLSPFIPSLLFLCQCLSLPSLPSAGICVQANKTSVVTSAGLRAMQQKVTTSLATAIRARRSRLQNQRQVRSHGAQKHLHHGRRDRFAAKD